MILFGVFFEDDIGGTAHDTAYFGGDSRQRDHAAIADGE
jgi:hypothetical protein